MSVHTWGENPEGNWTLNMSDANVGTSMFILLIDVFTYFFLKSHIKKQQQTTRNMIRKTASL
jgi:subtilisin-like proprotein convertase family protein